MTADRPQQSRDILLNAATQLAELQDETFFVKGAIIVIEVDDMDNGVPWIQQLTAGADGSHLSFWTALGYLEYAMMQAKGIVGEKDET